MVLRVFCKCKMNEVLHLDVGGMRYSLAAEDILKHSGSFFECQLKKEWSNGDEVVSIARDGKLFKYVYAFMVIGHLPRDKHGHVTLDSDTLCGIREEADYYGLEDLTTECLQLQSSTPELSLKSYVLIKKYLGCLTVNNRLGGKGMEVEHALMRTNTTLLTALSEVWDPSFVIDCVADYGHTLNDVIHKSSTLSNLNFLELLQEAVPAITAEGEIDNYCYEIGSVLLNQNTLDWVKYICKIKEFYPARKKIVVASRLEIHEAGAAAKTTSVRDLGDGHLGTLVINLGSKYTGGEFTVSSPEDKECIKPRFGFAVMAHNCSWKVSPVKSGTRVSLVFEVFEDTGSAGTTNTVRGQGVVAIDTPTDQVADSESGQDSEDSEDSEEDEEESDIDSDEIADALEDQWDSDSDSDDEGPGIIVVHEPVEVDEQAAVRFCNNRYWRGHSFISQDAAVLRAIGVAESLQTKLPPMIDESLQDHEYILIGLMFFYAELKVAWHALKGGDLALYEFLSEQYHVEIVTVVVSREVDQLQDQKVEAVLASLEDIKMTLSDHDRMIDDDHFFRKRKQVPPPAKLLLPSLLYYCNELESGNSHGMLTTHGVVTTYYAVTALQVRCRSKCAKV